MLSCFFRCYEVGKTVKFFRVLTIYHKPPIIRIESMHDNLIRLVPKKETFSHLIKILTAFPVKSDHAQLAQIVSILKGATFTDRI